MTGALETAEAAADDGDSTEDDGVATADDAVSTVIEEVKVGITAEKVRGGLTGVEEVVQIVSLVVASTVVKVVYGQLVISALQESMITVVVKLTVSV